MKYRNKDRKVKWESEEAKRKERRWEESREIYRTEVFRTEEVIELNITKVK